MTPIDKYDGKRRYCPMLGHHVTFSYCRHPGSDTPCRTVFDCWWEVFEIEEFIREHFDETTIEQMLAPRKDKVLTLLELIDKARKNAQASRRRSR